MSANVTAESRILLAAARTRLMCYAALHYPTFDLNWHLFDIARYLEKVDAGSITRLTVAAPLRHGKSWLCSQLFLAWFLSRHPELTVMVITYSADLAAEFGREVRNLLMSPLNQLVFPECRLAPDSTAADRFHTTAGGGLQALGLEGSIYGRGADLIVIDDSLRDPRDVRREEHRRNLRDRFKVIFTRQSPTCRLVIAAARSHALDLTGWLLREHSEERWVSLSYAALAIEDERWRKKGEPLWPSRYSREKIRGIEAMLNDTAAFDSLMQQLPQEGDGPIFKGGVWHWTDGAVKFRSSVQSWDLAHKTGDANDYSACLTFAWQGDHWVIVDVFRDKLEFAELVEKVKEHAKVLGAQTLLVEEGGPGIPCVKALEASGIGVHIESIRPVGSKEARAHASTASIKSSFVRLLRKARGVQLLLNELEEFPDGEHDDLVDCLTQAAAYFQTHPGIRPEDFLDLIKEGPERSFRSEGQERLCRSEEEFYEDPLDWSHPKRR